MIEQAELWGDLKPNTTIIEATGGSTGSSLAFICAVKGYKFLALLSNAYANEKLRTMTVFRASLDITHSPSGKATADLIISASNIKSYKKDPELLVLIKESKSLIES